MNCTCMSIKFAARLRHCLHHLSELTKKRGSLFRQILLSSNSFPVDEYQTPIVSCRTVLRGGLLL